MTLCRCFRLAGRWGRNLWLIGVHAGAGVSAVILLGVTLTPAAEFPRCDLTKEAILRALWPLFSGLGSCALLGAILVLPWWVESAEQ